MMNCFVTTCSEGPMTIGNKKVLKNNSMEWPLISIYGKNRKNLLNLQNWSFKDIGFESLIM